MHEYVLVHPTDMSDRPMLNGQDFELIRIFDSMVFESETNEEVTAGISAQGAVM